MHKVRGIGQMVGKLAFHSEDSSSNTAKIYSFFYKILLVKNENKNKEQGSAHYLDDIICSNRLMGQDHNHTHTFLT